MMDITPGTYPEPLLSRFIKVKERVCEIHLRVDVIVLFLRFDSLFTYLSDGNHVVLDQFWGDWSRDMVRFA